MHSHVPPTRPAWWPENEPWPPRRRFARGAFFRRLGCLFGALNFIGLAALTAGGVALARAFGLWPADPPLWVVAVRVGVALLAVGGLAVGAWRLRAALAPLDDLLAAADRVAQGDYSQPVDERGPRPVRALARAFNNMAARLERQNRQRRDLLADVAHELRTPLTVLRGNLEGMLDGVYPADPANLRLLIDEADLLARLVEDLRTLALAESGALELRFEPTDLGLLVRDTLAAFQAPAAAANVRLQVETPADWPEVRLDPGRMRQVLVNLLANAVRFTPPGGLVSVVGRLAGGQVEVEVRDTGPGIPPEDLGRLFERFHKSTQAGGTGLGLAIAWRLVEAHGGHLRAESLVGQGTVMRLTLPLSPETPNA